MNTHRIRKDTKNVFKSALNVENRDEVFIFLEEAKKYILSLKIKQSSTGKLINVINSNFRTGFRGFVIDIISLTLMYRELVEEHHWLVFFATYRISQDHIEILFGRIRGMNGNNDNPMPHQFQSSYRKILHQCEMTNSPYSNVRDIAASNGTTLMTSNILSVPSTRQRRSNLMEDVESVPQQPDAPSDDIETFEETYEFELILHHNHLSDSTNNSGIAFIANGIEQKCLNSSQIYCNSCIEVIKNNEKVDDKMCINPKLGKPCLSTYQICKLTDISLKTLINTGQNFKQKIYSKVISSLQWQNIFPVFFPHEHDFEHKLFLIKFIVDDYVNRKCNYMAKQTTLDTQKKYIRNKLRKLCHYLNL